MTEHVVYYPLFALIWNTLNFLMTYQYSLKNLNNILFLCSIYGNQQMIGEYVAMNK